MNIQTTQLANGLTVITDSLPGFETVAVGLWVDVGARDETQAQNGLSHMLEHMAFKGTTSRSALDIALEVERVGGHLNAYTAREQTCFFARVLKDDAPLAVDILADILLNPTFDGAEIAREQQVILQEIGQAEDTPDDILFDHLQEAAYPGQAFGRPILGSVKHVKGFGADDLRSYLTDHYRGGRMVLAASGGIDHASLVALGERYCTGFATGTARGEDQPVFAPKSYIESRPLEQAHIALAYDGMSYGHADYYAAQVLATALGGGMSSRLFQEVREKRGLAYSVSAWASPASDCGSYGFYAGTSEDDLPELLTVLRGEIGRAATGFSEDEVASAKAQLKAGMMMGLESLSNRAEQWARQWLVQGRLIPIEEVTQGVEAVTAVDLARLAGDLAGSKPAISAIGALGKLNSVDAMGAHLDKAA